MPVKTLRFIIRAMTFAALLYGIVCLTLGLKHIWPLTDGVIIFTISLLLAAYGLWTDIVIGRIVRRYTRARTSLDEVLKK